MRSLPCWLLLLNFFEAEMRIKSNKNHRDSNSNPCWRGLLPVVTVYCVSTSRHHTKFIRICQTIKKKSGKPNLKVGNCAIFITYTFYYYYSSIYAVAVAVPSFRRSFVRLLHTNRTTNGRYIHEAIGLRVSAYGTSATNANCIVCICVDLDV